MSIIDDAIRILSDNSLLDEAQNLERLSSALNSDDSEMRATATEELRGLCQVRAYGDLNITTMNGWKWNSILEEVISYAEDRSG